MSSEDDDPWELEGTKRWIQHVIDDSLTKLATSAVAISVVPNDVSDLGAADVRYFTELGAMICMDKPIIAVAFEGRLIPPKLRAIADEIVILEDGVDPAGARKLQAAIERQMGDTDG